MDRGLLVISLDFELFWGVRDVVHLDDYRPNLLGVREAVPAILDLFSRRGIHATWATVGFLFFRTKRDLLSSLPARLPRYADAQLSPYEHLEHAVGDDERTDPFHFAPTLLERIAATAGQEIGTHTFSHYYSLEPGQTAADFDADLEAAARATCRIPGASMRSIVFPRNQFNASAPYREVLQRHGVHVLRTNGGHWAYPAGGTREKRRVRAIRLADAYLPIAGARTWPIEAPDEFGLVDVRASAFLRPYRRALAPLDTLKVRRITTAMRRAAERKEVFHLWWHPHNFGVDLRENLRQLEQVLDAFGALRAARRMESVSMAEAVPSFERQAHGVQQMPPRAAVDQNQGGR